MISYCKNGKSAQVLACPQEKLNEILDSPEVAVACQKLTTVDHDSDEAKTLKQGLPLLMFFWTILKTSGMTSSLKQRSMAVRRKSLTIGKQPTWSM